MIRPATTYVAALLFTLVGWAAGAQSADQLVLLHGPSQAGQVVAIKDGAVQLAIGEDETESFDRGSWLRWNHPAPPPRAQLHFGGRSMLVAKQDWTGKVPITIDARQVSIENRTIGKVTIDRGRVDYVLIEAAKDPALATRLRREADQAADDDRVWLVDGDLLTGRVLDFDGTALHLELAGAKLPLLAGRIAALAFAHNAQEVSAEQPACLVGFTDGSLIEATDVELDEQRLELHLAGVGRVTSQRPSNLAFLQWIAEPVTYLSDLEPVDYRNTPYFTGSWKLARDQNLSGGPLQAGGARYAKGLAMHTASRVIYRVPDGAGRLCADLALDDTSGNRGSVTYRVYTLSSSKLLPVYESPVVRGGEPPQTIEVDIAGASAVVLVVDYADRGDELDHANWLDARFVP